MVLTFILYVQNFPSLVGFPPSGDPSGRYLVRNFASSVTWSSLFAVVQWLSTGRVVVLLTSRWSVGEGITARINSKIESAISAVTDNINYQEKTIWDVIFLLEIVSICTFRCFFFYNLIFLLIWNLKFYNPDRWSSNQTVFLCVTCLNGFYCCWQSLKVSGSREYIKTKQNETK